MGARNSAARSGDDDDDAAAENEKFFGVENVSEVIDGWGLDTEQLESVRQHVLLQLGVPGALPLCVVSRASPRLPRRASGLRPS